MIELSPAIAFVYTVFAAWYALSAAGQLVGPFVAQFSMQTVGLLMFVDTVYRYMMIYDDI